MDKITITKKAANEISRICDTQGRDQSVRLAVKGGGCAGFMYDFNFDSEKSKRDLEFESNGIYILCDKKSFRISFKIYFYLTNIFLICK